jgi:signal transduction histidine kinase
MDRARRAEPDGGARPAVWLLVGLGGGLFVVAMVLATLNHTFTREPFTLLSVAFLGTYAGVGAVLVRRVPRNPIGWLFLLAGLGVLWGGASEEYARYALETAPGSLPFAIGVAWLNNWSFLVVGVVPLILLLFPTGRLPSRAWRWFPGALIACLALLALAVMFRPGTIEVTTATHVENPLGVPSLQGLLDVVAWAAGLGLAGLSIAAVIGLVQRFRRSGGEERQQLRWLAAIAALMGVSLVLTLLTSIGLKGGASSPANDLSFLLFFLCLGIGIPAACAVAILKYHLYDLDIVVKRTVVFTIVAAFITLLYLGALALAAFTSIGAIAGAVIFVLTFNPVRRRAKALADRVVYGKRATPFEVLSEFSANLGDTYSVDDVLPRMTQLLAASTGGDDVRVWLRRDRSLIDIARWPADTPPAPSVELVDDAMPVYGPAISAFPVSHQGELLGAITLSMPTSDPMDASKERLVIGLASQAGLALQNVRLVDDLRASRRRIVAAQDERAKKLERNIHDGAQQQLVALAVKLRLLEQQIERDPASARTSAAELRGTANETLEDLRDLARGIYPPLLADKGLGAALEAQARKAAMPVTVSADGIARFGADVESAVYFSCLEALQNAAKYAEAREVRVRLTNGAGDLRFEVTDDGRGFDPATTSYGTGLQGIEDRLAAVGGELTVTSAPGDGTAVAGSVPVGGASCTSARSRGRSSSSIWSVCWWRAGSRG